MKKLRKVSIVLQRLQKPRDKILWENPRKSIGDPVGAARDGKCTYWEAIGPAREAWKDLGPNIKDCIENAACEYGSALSVEIYMFGCTKDTAAPQVLVCSMEPKARRQVLKAIETIMNDYPAIGLGEISQLSDLLPVPLSQDDIESDFLRITSTGNETVVLTDPQHKPFGRRILIPQQDGRSLRPATAGPILYIKGKVYQLTVGHAFLEFGDFPLTPAQLSDLESRGLEARESTDGRDPNTKLDLTSKSNPVIEGPRTGFDSKVQGSSSSAPEPSSQVATTRQPSLDSGVGLAHEDASTTNNHLLKPIVSRKLDRLGKLALLSDTSNPKSPDYGLIELEEAYRQGKNEVPRAANGSQRFLQVRRPAPDGPRDVNVITMTASFGFMAGRLCATASYVRFPNQRTLQELYPIRLEGKLADGDCGSGVIDHSTGHMYGHIVAGTAGTGRAYIVPVEQVFRDIQGRWGAEVTLVPPGEILEHTTEEKLKLSTLHKLDYSKRVDPLRVVEFASEEYFRKLKQPVQSNAHGDEAGRSTSASSSAKPRKPPNRREMNGRSAERSIYRVQGLSLKQQSARRLRHPHPISRPLPQLAVLEPRLSTVNRGPKGKCKEEGVGRLNMSKSLPFEERFFALPNDLQVQIIGYLCVPDILNLRVASKNWHELVSANETPISRAFLDYNPVPRFAIELFPLPAPPDLALPYICGLWHRLSVTSKLSSLMTDWITTDIFLRKDDVQQMEFLPAQARLRRRLVPLLFTIFHFFETYRHLHLKHRFENDHDLLPEGCKINPIDRKIMNMYDNETLLQIHQVFPFLLAYLDRKLRPPSFFGRLERSFHGYVRGSPPEHVYVGILCIGGLREVARLSAIENYDARRTAVDDWYASVSHEMVDSVPQMHRWPKALGRKALKQPSFSAAGEDVINTASPSNNIQPLSTSGDNHDDPKITNDNKNKNLKINALSSIPMPPLAAEYSRLLIPDLPRLEQIWAPTAEALLIARQAVERKQDIKKNGQAMHELILDEFTAADELFYGRSERGVGNGDARLGWGDLLDDQWADEI